MMLSDFSQALNSEYHQKSLSVPVIMKLPGIEVTIFRTHGTVKPRIYLHAEIRIEARL
jgi:hypothetical protein